ncbi:hypothetical protein GCM10023157_18300 [Gluconacetobacter asukensis]|uniref:DUF1003 domain-containing protein n=2 Tax=Gluconacetobacter asukensis TaxID=1017181 RepID=A0A7W4NY54_9PROT|nr:hypothetical protein [Gluconacetobacter asukensis]
MPLKPPHAWKPLNWFYRDRHRADRPPSAPRWIDTFNDRLAVKMTVMFGSIWCVYMFTVFSLLPVLHASWQGPLLYISNCIQLVALPALMVGNAVIARGTDQRAIEDHTALVEILNDVREELAQLRAFTAGIARTEQENKDRPADVIAFANEATITVNEPAAPTGGRVDGSLSGPTAG